MTWIQHHSTGPYGTFQIHTAIHLKWLYIVEHILVNVVNYICIHTSTQITKTHSVNTSAKMPLKNVGSSRICLQVALDRVLYLLMLFLVSPEQTGSFVYGHSADAIWSRFIINRFWRVSESPSGCALPAYAHRRVPYGQRTGVTQAQSDILNNDGGFEYCGMDLNAILVPVFL